MAGLTMERAKELLHSTTTEAHLFEHAIGVSAAETAVAIAIIINIYRNIRNIEVKNLREMKW